eukprot:SAG11_NODE_3798_length_2218_cov_1.281265_4_plen_88_part_00
MRCSLDFSVGHTYLDVHEDAAAAGVNSQKAGSQVVRLMPLRGTDGLRRAERTGERSWQHPASVAQISVKVAPETFWSARSFRNHSFR